MTGSAVISPCGTYRLELARDVELDPLMVGLLGPGCTTLLIGVNPSTADAVQNDATIRKDIGFAQRLGWARILKGNKFAYRATDVRELAMAADPVGPGNDVHLERMMREAAIVVACWGPLSKLPARLRGRWREVVAIAERVGKPLHCFGTAKDGQPLHTLMLPYSTPLVRWSPPL